MSEAVDMALALLMIFVPLGLVWGLIEWQYRNKLCPPKRKDDDGPDIHRKRALSRLRNGEGP